MKKVFVTTENTQQFDEICSELQAPDLVGPSLALVTGRAGRGKSEAAKHYAINSNAVYILMLQDTTPVMALRNIAFELSAIKPRTTDACVEIIGAEMQKERRLILADEADLVPLKTLEMLRGINERCGCPILFLGEDDLMARVASRRRIVSRIRRRMGFGPVSQTDLILFCSESLGVKITPSVAGILHRYSKGDWRPAVTAAAAIWRAIQASGIDEVTEELIREIVKNEEAKNRARLPD